MPDYSPFGPDSQEPDIGGGAGSMQPMPPSEPKRRSTKLEAALAALSALAMFTPIGKGGKALAAGIGIPSALSLASGAVQAQKLKGVGDSEKELDPGAIKVGSPGATQFAADKASGTDIQDEHTETLRSLRQQQELWQKQLNKGGVPKKETQDEVNRLNSQIQAITDKRAAKADKIHAESEANRLRTENANKAEASETARNNYRMWGGGAGVGLGALAALMSRNKLGKAVGAFEKTAEDVGKYTKMPGNLLVSKGNVAPELRSAVNTAYQSGGAAPPLPSMSAIRGAQDKTRLNQAKGAFESEASRVPVNAPFSSDRPPGITPGWMGLRGKSNADKVSSLHPIIEKGLPGTAAAEALGTLGAAQMTDNPDYKDMLHNAAWAGGTGAAGFMLGRKVGSLFTNGKPSNLATQAINSGRERLQNDAQTVGLKSLKKYQAQSGDLGTSGMPKPFTPGTPAEMAELRARKAAGVRADGTPTKGAARTAFASTAHQNDAITQAHAASMGPDGKVDKIAFEGALKQILGNRVQHQGHSVAIDRSFVNELLRAFGSG